MKGENRHDRMDRIKHGEEGRLLIITREDSGGEGERAKGRKAGLSTIRGSNNGIDRIQEALRKEMEVRAKNRLDELRSKPHLLFR